MTLQARFAELARSDGRGVLITVLARDGGAPGAKALLVTGEDRLHGSLGDPELDAFALDHAREAIWREASAAVDAPGARLFFDVTAPAPRLVIFGASDFAVALCRLARVCDWRPWVIDPRSRFAAPGRFPDAAGVIAAWPAEALAQLGGLDRATAVAVVTHDPKLDDAALLLALDSDAGYIGAMGSRRAQADRRARLLDAGVSEAQLERIHAPIGLDLGAASAEETALSILAEIVAVRNGRRGGQLTAARGAIHAAAA